MGGRRSKLAEQERRRGFLEAFRLTENGRVKSTLLLYSFLLSILFFGVYGVLYAALIDPLNALTAGKSVLLTNLVGTLVPSVIGTAVCSMTWFFFKHERRMMLSAYLWMLALVLACLVVLLLLSWGEGQQQILILQAFALFALCPLVMGLGTAVTLYCLYAFG